MRMERGLLSQALLETAGANTEKQTTLKDQVTKKDNHITVHHTSHPAAPQVMFYTLLRVILGERRGVECTH